MFGKQRLEDSRTVGQPTIILVEATYILGLCKRNTEVGIRHPVTYPRSPEHIQGEPMRVGVENLNRLIRGTVVNG
jgi:hypothetical protein